MKRHFASVFKTTCGFFALVAVALVLSRCGRESAGPKAGTFDYVYKVTLSTACIECHVPGGAATKAGVTLDFTDQKKAYATITAAVVSGNTSKGKCPKVKIVDADPKAKKGDPKKSFLAGVLFKDHHIDKFAGVATCKPYPKHLLDQNISADEKKSMLDWITAGAQNDE